MKLSKKSKYASPGFEERIKKAENPSVQAYREWNTSIIRKAYFEPEWRGKKGDTPKQALAREAMNYGSQRVAEAMGIKEKIPKDLRIKFFSSPKGNYAIAEKFSEWVEGKIRG